MGKQASETFWSSKKVYFGFDGKNKINETTKRKTSEANELIM